MEVGCRGETSLLHGEVSANPVCVLTAASLAAFSCCPNVCGPDITGVRGYGEDLPGRVRVGGPDPTKKSLLAAGSGSSASALSWESNLGVARTFTAPTVGRDNVAAGKCLAPFSPDLLPPSSGPCKTSPP